MSDLHVEQWGSGDRVAVLLHGLTSDSGTWWRLGPDLAELGYRVLAPDLLGHGRSPRRPSYSITEWVDGVRAEVPSAPALVVGLSLGGLVLAEAITAGLRPRRAIYADPAWAANDPASGLTDTFRAQASWTRDQVRAANPRWPDESVDRKHLALTRWDTATLDAVAGFGGLRPGRPEVPSLVVLADPSLTVPPAEAARLADTGHTVRVVPKTGHVLPAENYAGFRSALDGWL